MTEHPLSAQKRIDTVAVAFSLALALLIAIAGTLGITLIAAWHYSLGVCWDSTSCHPGLVLTYNDMRHLRF